MRSRIRLCGLALSVMLLTGCMQQLQDKLQSEINSSFDAVVGQLVDLSMMDRASEQSQKFAQELNDGVKDKKIAPDLSDRISASLRTDKDLTPVDRAYRTYVLARVQAATDKLDASDRTYQESISLTESLEPKETDLLSANYESYAILLDRMGNKVKAAKMKEKASKLKPDTKEADSK